MTLEHYYMGILVMPPGNGVSDGAFPIVIASIYSGIVGNNFWATPVYDVAWLGIEGVPMLTYGHLIALGIALNT